MADRNHRRDIAGAHAGRANDAHVLAVFRLQAPRADVSAPAIAQDSESQTRTVTAGGGVSPSFTTSKCA